MALGKLVSLSGPHISHLWRSDGYLVGKPSPAPSPRGSPHEAAREGDVTALCCSGLSAAQLPAAFLLMLLTDEGLQTLGSAMRECSC